MSNSNLNSIIFPFELYVENTKHKKLFIEDVEKILKTDLQLEDSFGCEIVDCHTHVGSKKHLERFIEAELLFHNSYYNKRFAFLTVQTILDNLKDNTESIVVVGYETFCELYVCEVMEMLEILRKEGGLARVRYIAYSIYEQEGNDIHIRNLTKCFKEFSRNTLIVYIVPINTTLTTHDKMMEKIYENQVFKNWQTKNDFYSLNIALITIAPIGDSNDFWSVKRIPSGENFEYELQLLEKKTRQLKYLRQNPVYGYVLVDNNWYKPQECKMCFPDIDKEGKLTDESPRFRVDKASIVPMLRIGKKIYPEPLDSKRKINEEENLKKIIKLSECLYHLHAQRGGNHYQYYFDLEKYFNNNKSDIYSWLQSIDGKFKGEKCYNFIIAPRHYSNAGFVRMVNDILFDGKARIFYFDVLKEYRSNIAAKYSDFIRALDNIQDANQKYEVNFHYIDDTILSGSNYNRAKSLIRTILGKKKDKRVHLFKSVILLLNRNSNESKKSYIDSIEYFFSYVNLHISSMRNHEDACILCRLLTDYQKMRDLSATNEIRDRCQKTINTHQIKSVIGLKEASREEKLRMIIRHILNVRIANIWWVEGEDRAINSESADDIYIVLNQLYNNESLFNTIGIDGNKAEEVRDYSVAFIKVITRPFFTDHIRQRQASMRFCLEKTQDFSSKINNDELLNTLIKGLSDLGANYLIRKRVIEKILRKNGSLSFNTLYYSSIKKLITFSGEDTQSYLLECILLNGKEYPFFNTAANSTLLRGVKFEQWMMLYLENNKVLYDGFEEYSNKKAEIQDIPYYMEYFSYICSLNMFDGFSGVLDDDEKRQIVQICEKYYSIRGIIADGCEGRDGFSFRRLEEEVNKLFQENEVVFFGCRNDKDIQFKYFPLGQLERNMKSSTGIEQNFFYEDNLQELDEILVESESDWIGNTIYFTEKFCVIRIKPEQKGNISNDLFIQIRYKPQKFDKPIFRYPENTRRYLRLLLFYIKIILLFRHRFEELANKQNISNLVGVAYQNEIKEALKIVKAHKHGTTEYYENLSWTISDEKRGGTEIDIRSYIGETGNKENLKQLFDIYLQVQANSYIVDLYRKAVLREAELIDNLTIAMGYLETFKENYLPQFGFDKKSMTYEIQVFTSKHYLVKVKMICSFQNDLQNQMLEFYKYGASPSGYSFILFMILMAMNAAIHGKRESDNSVEVHYKFGKDKIVIENKTECDENIKNDVRRKLKTAPWRDEKESITLWTLQKLSQIRNCGKLFEIEVEEGMFRVILTKFTRYFESF